MYAIIKNALLISGVVYLLLLSLGRPRWKDAIAFAVVTIPIFVITALVIAERIRRLLEGYYVTFSGGAEDGDVTYNEKGRTLRLYFQRSSRMIYVPTDERWSEIMPAWARHSKTSIVSRIKQRIGKHWKLEETDKQEYFLRQT